MKQDEDYLLDVLTQEDGSSPWAEGKPFEGVRIARFALGVAYRFAVSRHANRRLGPYEERIAHHLRRGASFPDGVCALGVALDSSFRSGLVLPSVTEQRGHTQYQFVVLGSAFFVFVGADMPEDFRRRCLGRGGQLLRDVDNELLFTFARNMLTAKPTGPIAKWHAANDSASRV